MDTVIKIRQGTVANSFRIIQGMAKPAESFLAAWLWKTF